MQPGVESKVSDYIRSMSILSQPSGGNKHNLRIHVQDCTAYP